MPEIISRKAPSRWTRAKAILVMHFSDDPDCFGRFCDAYAGDEDNWEAWHHVDNYVCLAGERLTRAEAEQWVLNGVLPQETED